MKRTSLTEPFDKQAAIRTLRGGFPLSRDFRHTLAEFLEGRMSAKRGPKRLHEPLPYIRSLLLLRDWINESIGRERAEAKSRGKPFDEDRALDTLVPNWRMSRRSLRIWISRQLSPHKELVRQIQESWRESVDDHREFD